MATTYPHMYDAQIESYISQFLRVFSGLQVRDGVDRDSDGENDLRSIPVYYGSTSRVVSSILNKRRSFTNPVLPLMAGFLESVELDVERRGPNKYHTDVVTYKDDQGNYQNTERMIGPSLILNVNLGLYASSHDEMFQMLEQILLLFNPKITIQTSEDILDQNYISQIELTQINQNTSQALGTDEQVLTTDLTFQIKVKLNYPHVTRQDDLIKKIITNMYSDEDMITKLDDVETTDS